MKKVIIMRGPSGSGKSTMVKSLIEENFEPGMEYKVVSADEFFMVETEFADPRHVGPGPAPRTREYRFDPTKLGEAHAWCLGKFISTLCAGYDLVIVDNTNVHNWEWGNYLMLAKSKGYSVEIHELRPVTIEDIRVCQKRNIHRVPPEVVAKMCYEFEDCDSAIVHPISGDK